jgi:hypothetical protein
MKSLNQLIFNKKKADKMVWDNKSIFFAFQRVIKEEYGNSGIKNLIPNYYKNKKLFVNTLSSVWASELMLNRTELITKINQELGQEEIVEIKINN